MDIFSLYRSLRKNSNGIVTHFKTDWRVDRNTLRVYYQALFKKELDALEFVHVSRDNGTLMFPIYRNNLDTRRKFLFGYCTPRQTLRDYAGIFHSASRTLPQNCIIQHFDGRQLVLITKSDARSLFLEAASKRCQQRDRLDC